MKELRKYTANTTKSSLSFEEAYELPEYSSKKELIGFLIKNKDKKLFPKKDLAEQKRICRAKLEKKMEKNPDMLFKDLLAQLLEDLPADYPVEMIAPLTKFLSGYWVKKYADDLVC